MEMVLPKSIAKTHSTKLSAINSRRLVERHVSSRACKAGNVPEYPGREKNCQIFSGGICCEVFNFTRKGGRALFTRKQRTHTQKIEILQSRVGIMRKTVFFSLFIKVRFQGLHKMTSSLPLPQLFSLQQPNKIQSCHNGGPLDTNQGKRSQRTSPHNSTPHSLTVVVYVEEK